MAGIQIDGVNNKIDFDDDQDTSISSATDDTLVVEVGGNTLATVTATSVTFNDGVEITTADNTDTLTLTSTDADANAGPILVLNRDSGSPADGDSLGALRFAADDDAGNSTDWFKIETFIRDASNGSEDVQMVMYGMSGGNTLNIMEFDTIGGDVDAGPEVVFNDGSADIDFRVESNGNANAIFVDANNDRVGIGTSSPDYTLHVRSMGSPSNDTVIDIEGNATDANCVIQFTDSGGTLNGRISYDTDDDNLQFSVVATEQMRITNGTLMIGCTTATPGVSNTTNGLSINTNGRLFSNAATNGFSQFATSGDGNILSFASAGNGEGEISISGSTVTYGAFTGTHWSRLADNSKPTILRGTLVESLDEMCDWYQAVADVAEVKYTAEDEEVKSGSKNVGDVKETAYKKRVPITLPDGKAVGDAVTFTFQGETHTGVYEKETDIKHVKSKISDTADSKKIYGLFSHWDSNSDYLDDDVNDMNIAQVGTFIIRVHKDVTVEAGDLLVSNGDGTAKKQDDDIIRSKTVAKVNSNIKVETYSDGSYTVPCTLHC